jgi:hypothetical protein
MLLKVRIKPNALGSLGLELLSVAIASLLCCDTLVYLEKMRTSGLVELLFQILVVDLQALGVFLGQVKVGADRLQRLALGFELVVLFSELVMRSVEAIDSTIELRDFPTETMLLIRGLGNSDGVAVGGGAIL